MNSIRDGWIYEANTERWVCYRDGVVVAIFGWEKPIPLFDDDPHQSVAKADKK